MCLIVGVFSLTHWVEQHGEKQLSPTDAFVQFFWSSGVFLIVDGVSKQATRLARQHLHTKTQTQTYDIFSF